MKVFINDMLFEMLDAQSPVDLDYYNVVLDANTDSIVRSRLINHVLIKNAGTTEIDNFLDILNAITPTRALSVTMQMEDYKVAKKHLKSKFNIVKAAGGLVRKNNKVLMIYRLKKWDLPKGKLNKHEKAKVGAIREVEEECNVQVTISSKICSTWHTYTMNNKNMIKKTKWYAMDLVDDSAIKPQVEEDIEDVRWLTPKEVYVALKNSYQSIVHVFERYDQIMKSKLADQSSE
ncbi:MAG: NUDIX domain-containing protein [Bacteroidota bacterium]